MSKIILKLTAIFRELSDVRKAVFFSAVARYSTLVITVVTVAIVSRLLTPEEIGVFSIAASLIALSQVLRNLGVHSYIVKYDNIKIDILRTCLTLTLIPSVIFVVVIYIFSEFIGRFYNEAIISDLMKLLCISFLLGPLSIPPRAMFERELKFGPLVICDIIAAIVQGITVISLSLSGFSYYSLVWGSIAEGAARWTFFIFAAPRYALLQPSLKDWKKIIPFGTASSGAGIVIQLGRSSPDLIIGRILGISDVAQFSRAQALLTLYRQTILAVVTPITLPLLARARQAPRAQLEYMYIRYISLYTGVAMPFLAFCLIMAEEVILVFFGDQWLPAVPVARMLCFGMLFLSISEVSTNFLLALDKASRVLQREIVAQLAYVIAILLTVHLGLSAVAGGVMLAYFIGTIWAAYIIQRAANISALKTILAGRSSMLVAAGSSIGPLLIELETIVNIQNPFISLIAAMALSVLGWFLAIKFVKHPLWIEIRNLKTTT